MEALRRPFRNLQSSQTRIVCKIRNPPVTCSFRQLRVAYWEYEMEAHIQFAHPRLATLSHLHGDYLVSASMVPVLDFDPTEEALGKRTTPWTALEFPDILFIM
jgi:hypothetical protein